MTFIHTNEYYRDIINARDMATREELYEEKILEPWTPVMKMMSGMFKSNFDSDPYSVARAWGWLLPENLTSVPESLTIMENAGAWEIAEAALADAVRCFTPYKDKLTLDLDAIEGWLVLADPSRSDPVSRGYTGAVDFATNERFVVQYSEPNMDNISKLRGAFVHEFNHMVRSNARPWNIMTATVGQYIVHEGLAESFAASLYGEDVVGYYVTDITPEDLLKAKTLIKDGLYNTGFDLIRGYIFGDWTAEQWGTVKLGMPNFGGYAVGYHVVQAFLKNTGCSIEEATVNVEAHDLIDASGYFEA
jgi:uncharacterized protein YjaZ